MKFQVTADVTISMHCIVEAGTALEAVERAEEAGMMSLCWQCASSAEGERRGVALDEWRTSGEIDGTPVIHRNRVTEYKED